MKNKFEIGKYYRFQRSSLSLDLIYKITSVNKHYCTFERVVCITGIIGGHYFTQDSQVAHNSIEFDEKYIESIKLLYEK